MMFSGPENEDALLSVLGFYGPSGEAGDCRVKSSLTPR